jgi:hypothetical protein
MEHRSTPKEIPVMADDSQTGALPTEADEKAAIELRHFISRASRTTARTATIASIT